MLKTSAISLDAYFWLGIMGGNHIKNCIALCYFKNIASKRAKKIHIHYRLNECEKILQFLQLIQFFVIISVGFFFGRKFKMF